MRPRLVACAAGLVLVLASLPLGAGPARAQEPAPPRAPEDPPAATDSVSTQEGGGPRVGHGERGWEFETADGNFLIQLQPRLQFRYAYPYDEDPNTLEDTEDDQHIFRVNRARLKIGGHGFRPWLKYFFEYELQGNALLDFRASVEKWDGLRLKVGQWKAQYSRERVISSGRQQMLDRSLINRSFTIDRQQGLSLFGRLAGGGAADVSYWASVFTGMGRGARQNDDENLMWMGRLQWNFLGRVVPFVGSDLERRDKPAGSLVLGAVTNRSPFTRFSTAGGGQLPGFEEGEEGQYRVNQALIETAFMFGGFAWQQEFHWKEINDHVNETQTTLVGNYLQLGYFFHELWPWIPRPLELAFRYSIYDPDTDRDDDISQEFAWAVNWFFHGHNNKLTADLTLITQQTVVETVGEGLRFRLQWDISF